MARKRNQDDGPSIIGEAPPDTDYAEMLEAPVALDDRCPHSTKEIQRSACSLCIGWGPSMVITPLPRKPNGRTRPTARPRRR